MILKLVLETGQLLNNGGTCDWTCWTSATWASTTLYTLPATSRSDGLGADSDGCGKWNLHVII